MRSTALLSTVILLFTVAISVLTPLSNAQDCLDYGETMHWIGSYFYNDYREVTQRDNLLYLAGNSPTLRIVDVSDPAAPVIVGELNTTGQARGIALSGDHAYVASGNPGLEVMDISDPANPVFVGGVATSYHALGVTVAADYAYVTSGFEDLRVVDISDPSMPTIVAIVETPGYAQGVAVSGHHLYIADNYTSEPIQDLRIYDISNPIAPEYVTGVYVGDSSGTNVDVMGQYAFLSCWNFGVYVIDISEPTAPQVTGSVYTGSTRGVTAAGDYIYVAGSGLWVVDIVNFVTPMVLGNVTSFSAGQPYDVALVGDHAYVATHGGLHVVDVATPFNADVAGSLQTPGPALQVAVSGEYAYVAMGREGLRIIDLAVPTAPVGVSTLDTPDYAGDVAVGGHHVFVADGDAGLQVVDVLDPTAPVLVGAAATSDSAMGVDVAGDIALVADYFGGLQIFDVADPTAPVLIGMQELGIATAVTAAGNHAYVCASDLIIVDVSNPVAPFVAGQLDPPGYAASVTVTDEYAYLAAGSNGLQIADVTDPTAPYRVGAVDTPSLAYGIAVFEGHAYVADHLSGLQVINVVDPLFPFLVGAVNTPSSARGVALAGDVVYIANTFAGLQEAWRQCGASVPVLLADFAITGEEGVAEIRWTANVADGDGEFRLSGARDSATWNVAYQAEGFGQYRAIDRPALELAGSEVTYTLHYRQWSGEWTHLATETTTLTPPPLTTRLVGASPNPFNPHSEVHFTVGQPQQVRIAVFDLVGRQVAVLADQIFTSGPQSVAWDGRNARGRELASGTYIARLEARQQTDTCKIMLVQ